ncbi:ribonuclease M5 [Fictibacillus aquaticus]|uniref:Ribonuclease M5 n=1 Tax=Fictibacillus aquaticus TaxID=2021314 RepID=A0A235F7J1_9BACL|nr:ribonuclease M5 [Fictibacillus aquaticus]OYD57013.1 ribonuclease M5 [Fictibacillus aquaticus]
MKIKEIIVVEGKSDTIAIKNVLDADTLETNGSEISADTIERIKIAQQKRGVIVFTDPDFPGEKIRKIITEHVPGCKHAFLPKQDAISKNKKKVGVEHASKEAILEALKHVKEEYVSGQESVSWEEMIAAGLTGGDKAKNRRERIGQLLKIGYSNGKQLHKRLNMFHISNEEFARAMRTVLEEEQHEEGYISTTADESDS